MKSLLEDLGAKETGNDFTVTLSNGIDIQVTKDPEHNGETWAWKVGTMQDSIEDYQIFSKDEYAASYLKRLIAEKITGIRLINRKPGTVPEICGGGDGKYCRHPGICDRMLCSRCPVAEQTFADRDGVKLVYASV